MTRAIVLDYLTARGVPVTPSTIARHVGRGVRSVIYALHCLRESGQVERVGVEREYRWRVVDLPVAIR